MPIIRRCKNCKFKIEKGEEVCPVCGHKQRAQSEPPIVTQTALDPLPLPHKPVTNPQIPAKATTTKVAGAGVETGSADKNIIKLKLINKMILQSKSPPGTVDGSEQKAKTIKLIESLDLPNELDALLDLYSDLRILKLRTKSYIQGDVDEAIMNSMGNILQTAKMKFGTHPRTSVLEKDFSNLKREKYLKMLSGLAVITIILYLILK